MSAYKALNWGAVLSLLSGACVYAWYLFGPPVHFEALSLPLVLKAGNVHTPEFTTDMELDYEIALDFDRRSNIGNIECYLGSPGFSLKECDGTAGIIDMSWEVVSGGQIMAWGRTPEISTSFSYPQDAAGRIVGPTSSRSAPELAGGNSHIQRIIGQFRARKGAHYSLDLKISTDASVLQGADPRLVVQIPVGYHEDFALRNWFRRATGLTLGAVGVLGLMASYSVRLLRKKSEQTNQGK